MNEDDWHRALLSLGYALGALKEPQHRLRLVQSIQQGELRVGYIQALRDELTAVLNEVSTAEH